MNLDARSQKLDLKFQQLVVESAFLPEKKKLNECLRTLYRLVYFSANSILSK